MKNILIIFLVFSSFSVKATERNSFCNFLLELGEGVEMDSTYKMTGMGFENLKLKHKEKLMTLLDYPALINTTVNMLSLQKALSTVCRYKKWEIEKVHIIKKKGGVLLELHYQVIPKDAKSKSQATWGRA
ncbi:MAG: hypothetical protein P8I55_05430 [Crocinitomix sp.]|nr:hypothetical protein [Crocinitomix sp.]